MTTAEHDPTTQDGDPVTAPAETGVGTGTGVADTAPPTPPAADHPDPSAATTARWESEGGHLHR